MEGVINFVIADHFKVDKSDTAPVKICYIDADFRLNFYGKTEKVPEDEAVPRRYHDLRRESLDMETIADLGSEAKAVVTMNSVYKQMKIQRAGEGGLFLTNGCANFFHSYDKDDVLRPVRIRWWGGGWDVRANSIWDPPWWISDRRVFSR